MQPADWQKETPSQGVSRFSADRVRSDPASRDRLAFALTAAGVRPSSVSKRSPDGHVVRNSIPPSDEA
jgi:hypothetical protein